MKFMGRIGISVQQILQLVQLNIMGATPLHELV